MARYRAAGQIESWGRADEIRANDGDRLPAHLRKSWPKGLAGWVLAGPQLPGHGVADQDPEMVLLGPIQNSLAPEIAYSAVGWGEEPAFQQRYPHRSEECGRSGALPGPPGVCSAREWAGRDDRRRILDARHQLLEEGGAALGGLFIGLGQAGRSLRDHRCACMVAHRVYLWRRPLRPNLTGWLPDYLCEHRRCLRTVVALTQVEAMGGLAGDL